MVKNPLIFVKYTERLLKVRNPLISASLINEKEKIDLPHFCEETPQFYKEYIYMMKGNNVTKYKVEIYPSNVAISIPFAFLFCICLANEVHTHGILL